MAEILVCFKKPGRFDLVGQLIKLRTGDEYHHSFIVANGVKYDPTFPRVGRVPLNGQPPKADLTLAIPCSDVELAIITRWLEEQVGGTYDWLAIIGWIFGIKEIEFKLSSYCHEFCREVLVLLGRVIPSNDQITAKRLLTEVLGV